MSRLGVLAAVGGDIERSIELHGQALLIRASVGVAEVAFDVQRLSERRARVGDDVLLRALGNAIGPEHADAVLALLDEAAGTGESA